MGEAILPSIDDLVKSYQMGRITKGAAIEQILDTLRASPQPATEEQRREAFASYLHALDSHEQQLAAAGRRGRATALSFEPIEETPEAAGRPSETRESVEPDSRKRKHSPEPDTPSGILRKQAPDESLYAWTGRSQLSATVLNPNLELTRRMVLNHGTDLKNARLHLLTTPGVPRFPDSEWGNVLLGKAVSLDVVLSGAYATHDEAQSVEQVGNFELRFGASKPVKSVQTSGDWMFAWHRTSTAIGFAFPHRASELSRYAEYILGLFASKRVESHGRVISLDKAIRKFAGESNDVELSDLGAFKQLEVSFLDVDGINHNTERTKGKPKRKGDWRSENVCRQFNEGKCTREVCRFKHACRGCGGDHREGECKEKGKGSA
jgi:hypothetical protein